MTQTKTTHKTVHKSEQTENPAQQTFMDHIRELQSRLFYIALVFLVTAGAAYPFFTQISQWIVSPLGTQELVYLTPGGAFGFVIKVCMYVGLIATLPVMVYHVFQFLSPVMPAVKRRQIVAFTISSIVLALIGIMFAYYVSLPASLYFLTSFNIDNINPMLTIDSYFSFAMAYLVAGAILFQLPLILMIIDSISPLTPKKLMTYQRHVILGSVIVAAIISPTPDVMNQMLLAAPLVAMYQAGIGMVGVQHSRRTRTKNHAPKPTVVNRFDEDFTALLDEFEEEPLPQQTPLAPQPIPKTSVASQPLTKQISIQSAVHTPSVKSVDGFRPRVRGVVVPNRTASQHLRRNVTLQTPRRSIDGILTLRTPA